MVNPWEPGVQYCLGDIVEHQGARYKIIQPHRSQGDWAPDLTPALWGRIPDAHFGGEEKKKNWYDLDSSHRKELGSGLPPGLAPFGAGNPGYKHHEESGEDEKVLIWAAQAWLREAEARTRRYYQYGPQGPCSWVLVQGHKIPQGAIVAGESHGTQLYISRAFIEGGIYPGKASSSFRKGCIIGYDGKEIEFDTYEVLVGNRDGLRWVDMKGTFEPQDLGVTPVEGGRDRKGEPFYVAQASYKGGVYPGNTGAHLHGASISYEGEEKIVDEYRVLAYA